MTHALKALPWTVLALLLFCWAGRAPAAGRTEPAPTAPGLAYVVRYEGEVAPDTLELLRAVSKSESLRQSPPDSALLLENRAEEDRASFLKVFSSDGHFAATVDASVDTSVSPAVLTFHLVPGPRFNLDSVRFLLPDGREAPASAVPDPAGLGLAVPGPFAAKAVVDAEDRLAAYPRRHGHPFAKVTHRQVTADFASHEVAVVWTLDPGPRANFGPVSYAGLASVKEGFLAGLVPWSQGDPYDLDLLARYRKKLSGLDLFASVQVEPGDAVAPDGQVPVVVTVTERKHRTIKGGVDYKTDEGPGANLGWEHRNLFGGGEKLSISASASAIERNGEATFEKPDCITPKELFRVKAKVADEDKKAYKGQNGTATAVVRRQFTDAFSAGAGLGYRTSRIEEDKSRPWDNDTRYGFVFVPLEAGLDTRDDVLDPHKGVVTSLSLAPYFGTEAKSPDFLRPEASVASYWHVAEKPGLILAMRAAGGANFGADRQDISPDLRFFAGGSGSIRGYGYQSVGPMRGKTPVGGASVLTFSTELRLRLTELIGVVPFLDGGTAFAESLPPYHQPLMLGAGLGLRVYTPIGPVRVDVATPLARRKDIDDIVQFYCSIGQSF
jgi:translocation and assembly module TamA